MSLTAYLAGQARAVTATTLETIRRWQQQPPASNEAGLNELLAYAAHDVAR
ncbi:hypothetical protein ABH931_002803 [Streptacidiphilus sp. MAP12-33]|uniref:hypothetical protein n=1 Tax=Streptacidiphilus sp. MAP12-33 TaxID=3156266 RepID=UPI0035175010